jgi:hypothetical protein
MERTDIQPGMDVKCSEGDRHFTARIVAVEGYLYLQVDSKTTLELRYYKKTQRWQASRGQSKGVRSKPVIVREIIQPTKEDIDEIPFLSKRYKSRLHAINVFAVKCGVDADIARKISETLYGWLYFRDRFTDNQLKELTEMSVRARQTSDRLEYIVRCCKIIPKSE